MFVNKPWLRFIVEPEGGEPSGGAPAPTDPPESEDPKPEDQPKDDDEKLGEPGLKALKAERAAREKAEQKIAAYEAEKEKARIAKLDGKEKAEAERDALAKERDEARAEAAVERAARKHSITDDKDLKLLASVPADQVEAFAARLAKAPSAGKSGLPAGGGREKPKPTTLGGSIAAHYSK
ncbi:hypothetical protein EU244_012815 [Rhodococcus qingshengii]|uniref:hypothetical protein n=1 Tax=Rhodococcus qingshengii TaxID=334542 RepID=UPI0010A66DA9|nr:hypothetical protein [Rhodococcus qingshengii]THJ69980.1 hypothetical protein EU244_20185 [Rhodococcus qingshengii]